MDYFDLNQNLSREDKALKMAIREFAREEIRPVSRQLDAMSAEQVVAKDSPLWPLLKKVYELDLHAMALPEAYGGQGLNPLQLNMVWEELAWGSFGLAVQIGVLCFPFYLACMIADDQMVENFIRPFCECRDGSIRGCWCITEPNHGSDTLAVGEAVFTSPKTKGDVTAVADGDEYVINGQKSAWVSGATIATHTMLHCQIDGAGGMAGSGVCLLPLDLKGISKGKPLEKIGQRDLNQGEIFFDNVRVPRQWMICEPEYYVPFLDMILAAANLSMSAYSTGLARAAFEESLVYSKQRVQGGKAIIGHHGMRQRIFQLFARTESCRAISRAGMDLNFNISPPNVEYSLWAKTQCTEMAYQNTHEAIQIWGGNGLTKEYLVEKLFRDARATLIEDGSNETLAAHGGHVIAETYPRPALDL